MSTTAELQQLKTQINEQITKLNKQNEPVIETPELAPLAKVHDNLLMNNDPTAHKRHIVIKPTTIYESATSEKRVELQDKLQALESEIGEYIALIDEMKTLKELKEKIIRDNVSDGEHDLDTIHSELKEINSQIREQEDTLLVKKISADAVMKTLETIIGQDKQLRDKHYRKVKDVGFENAKGELRNSYNTAIELHQQLITLLQTLKNTRHAADKVSDNRIYNRSSQAYNVISELIDHLNMALRMADNELNAYLNIAKYADGISNK